MPLLLQECPGIFINVWFSLKKHVRAALAPGAMAIKEMQFSQCVTAGFSSTFPSVLVFSAPHPPRKRVKFPVHCINYMGNEPLCPIQVAFWMYSPSSHSCMLIEACTVESTEWISERNLVWEGLSWLLDWLAFCQCTRAPWMLLTDPVVHLAEILFFDA